MRPFRNCADSVLIRFWLDTDLSYADIHHQLVYQGYKVTLSQLKYRMKKILKHYGIVPANATARHYRLSRTKTEKELGFYVSDDLI